MTRFIQGRPEFAALVAGFLIACGGRVTGSGTPNEPASSGSSSASDADGGAGAGDGGRSAAERGAGGRSGRSGSTPSSSGGDAAPGGSGDGNLGGSGGGHGSTDGDAGVAASGGTGAFDTDAGQSSLATEVWVGEVAHAITFQDYEQSATTPEHVVMVLTTSGGELSGSVVFGDRPPPAKASDPDAFYPPLTPDEYQDWQSVVQVPFNGFPYTLLDLRIESGRLTASLGIDELWHDWCALQAMTYPYPYVGGGYQCTRSTAPVDDHPDTPIGPLAKGDLCNFAGPDNGVCKCDQDTCHDNLDVNVWQLDLQMKDALYEGEVWSETSNGGFEAGSDGIWLPGIRLRRVK